MLPYQAQFRSHALGYYIPRNVLITFCTSAMLTIPLLGLKRSSHFGIPQPCVKSK
jgi:hypothetical protein